MFIEHLLEPGSLRVVFQPIVDFSDEAPVVCAVEALTRGPAGGQFERAPVLFDYVRLKREEVRFDRHCLAGALAAAGQFTGVRVHVNVHAATLERDPGFPGYVEAAAEVCDFDPARLMIELVEQSPYFEAGRLLEAVRRLRLLGVQIAMDDVGLGNSNYRMIVDAHPDCLKIDRYFVSGCASDRYRRSVIRSIRQIGRDFGATVIAEGVESEEDLQTLRDAGVTLGQGFLFARPAARPSIDLHGAGPQSPMTAAVCMEGT